MIKLAILVLSVLISINIMAVESTPDQKTNIPSVVAEFNHAARESRRLADIREWKESLGFSEKAVRLGKDLLKDKPAQLGALHYNHGVLLSKTYHRADAFEQFKIALPLYEVAYGKHAIELLPILTDYGMAGAAYNKRNSVKALKRTLSISKKSFSKDSTEYAEALLTYGVSQLFVFHEASAFRRIKRAYNILEKNLGKDSSRTGWAAYNLGKYKMAVGRHAEAARYLEQALSTFSRPDKPSNQFELSTHAFLVEIYERQNKSDQATKHCLAIGRMTPMVPTQDYKPLFKTPPTYPRFELMGGRDGWSVVEFDVDESGFVRDVKVVDRYGSTAFDAPSIAAAEKFRYAPAFVDGVAVRTKGVQNRLIYEIAGKKSKGLPGSSKKKEKETH